MFVSGNGSECLLFVLFSGRDSSEKSKIPENPEKVLLNASLCVADEANSSFLHVLDASKVIVDRPVQASNQITF